MMDERSIWFAALVDILSVIHIPGLFEATRSMSSEELRRRVLRMICLDRQWYQGHIVPRKIGRQHCETNTRRVQFIQGGEWVIVMFSNGQLQLCRACNLAEPSICIPCSTEPNPHFEMGISLSCRLETLVHVTERRWNSGYTDIRIYHVDVSVPDMSLRTPFRISQIVEPISLHCDRLAAPWMETITGRINVLIADMLDEQAEKRVVMDLGTRNEESHNFTIHVISQQSLLLAKPTEFFLFTIPECEAVNHSGDALVIPVQPIWTYSHRVQPVRGRPYISSLPCTSSDPQCGKISILTGKFIYLLSISNRPEDYQVLHYSLAKHAGYVPFRAAMGFRHAIWTEENSVKPFVTLQTCAYSTMPNGYGGLQRLSHVGQLGVQLRPIQLPIQNGEVIDVSWDEESGRLCLLISRSHGMNRVLVIDFRPAPSRSQHTSSASTPRESSF